MKVRAWVIKCWAKVRNLDPRRFLRLSRCESGRGLSDNDKSDKYAGPQNQAVRYWPGRAKQYKAVGPKGNPMPINNPWASSKVSTAMIVRYGWSATITFQTCGRLSV